MATRVDWGEFEYDGHGLLYAGYARMPPDQLPAFLLTADGDDRPHAWWLAQTRLYDLRTPGPNPSIREIRELLANAIRHGRLVVPESLREAERNADHFLRLTLLREQFSRRHVPPPTPRTSPPPNPSARVPATPSRAPSPRPAPSPRTAQNSPPGAMSLQGMLAHPTLMSLPLAAPVPVPGPTPHPLPLFTLVPQPGGIPVPAPGPNPPPLVPAYARYAAYTPQAPTRSGISPTAATTAAPSPRVTPPKHPESMDEDERRSRSDDDRSEHAPEFEIDELEDDAPNTRPGSKHGPAPVPRHDAPPYLPDPQPDRPKKRSRQTRPLPSSEPRICTTCSRTDSPEWRRGPYGPKTLCNACGLKWAKA
ncbi:blue light receptor, partial [Ceratobasidium sp. 394]